MSAPPPLACVSIPEFGLQALLQRPEALEGAALALVDRPGPQGRITACTSAAKRCGVHAGLRASAALGLCEGLRTSAIDDTELASIQDTICDELNRFSPRIEPGPPGSGAFWIDPSGMGRLYGLPSSWAEAIRAHLSDLGWRSTIVIGFRHFLTRAIAECSEHLHVFETPKEETTAAQSVELLNLGLPARRVAALASLQIETLGDLIRLPAADLRARFGAEVARLHADACGSSWRALRPRQHREPVRANIIIDPPEQIDERLLFAIKGILPKLIGQLCDAGERVHSLVLRLLLDKCDPIELAIEIAEPISELLPILDLIRLRLGALSLESPVTELVLTLSGSRPTLPQLDLLAKRERRDPRAAERALDRIRAAYGEGAVTRAQLRDTHLPEARFAWEPTCSIRQPRPVALAANLSGSSSCLIRRLLRRPIPLSSTSEVCLGTDPPMPSIAGAVPPVFGSIRRLHGPHRISGGWWVRPVERDYYYAETTGDEYLWLFYDRPRQRWFLHGVLD